MSNLLKNKDLINFIKEKCKNKKAIKIEELDDYINDDFKIDEFKIDEFKIDEFDFNSEGI